MEVLVSLNSSGAVAPGLLQSDLGTILSERDGQIREFWEKQKRLRSWKDYKERLKRVCVWYSLAKGRVNTNI